jgi:hypothetical protein
LATVRRRQIEHAPAQCLIMLPLSSINEFVSVAAVGIGAAGRGGRN